MINNRQGGRRRGRGGQRPQSLGGQPGNRQDNRQRGNAAQLLEKYKNMARDSQLAGDRVQTEYYLQYADHYFRVLGESRSRFEDQRRQRGDDFDDDDGDEDVVEAPDDQVSETADGRDRPERGDRPEPGDRTERGDRADRGDRFPRRGRERRPADRDDREGGRSGDGQSAVMNGGETIPFDVLPPAIGADQAPGDDSDAPRPRRRVRRSSAADGESEIAPAD